MAPDLLDTPFVMAGPLKVLLSGDEERATLIERRLRESGDTVSRCGRHKTLLAAVAAEDPDAIILVLDRPDRKMLDDLRQVSADRPHPAVMFTAHDDAAFMEEAISAGIGSYHVVTAELPDIRPIVMAAVAVFRRQQRLADELERAKTSLKERETIDRAKALLIRERNLDEPAAYRWLRRKAMNESKRIAAIAAELLARSEPGR